MMFCRCDVCKKEIDDPFGHLLFEPYENDYDSQDIDLCEECYKNVIPGIINVINLAKKGITIQ